MEDINIDKKAYNELKKLYEEAVEQNKTQFVFKNQDVLTKYAKYLLEYLSHNFGK